MDPLSAIGLISSVITFIDFGYEIVSASEEVRASATGTTKANEHIEFLNTRFKSVAVDLAAAKPHAGHMSIDQRRTVEVANKCLELSDDLQKLLDKLKANNPGSKRQVLTAITRNVRNINKKKDLEARLDQCQQLLQLQLSHTTRLEIISRLIEISETGKCQEKELGSLKQQIAVLTDTIAGMRSNSKLQDQARHILDLSDHAVSKVLQNNILESLQFEKMESRFDNIGMAYTETFKWLLEDTGSNSPTTPTPDSDDWWLRRLAYHLEQEKPMRQDIRRLFNNWLCTGTGIFHISGKPGAGKSTLMKYLVESDRMKEKLGIWADDKELVLASFFFWRHGTDFQRSLQGLLRSLLHSVLKQRPELTRIVFPAQWESARNSPGTVNFRHFDIQQAYINLMENPEIYLKHKFAFFIDGLDEFQGRDDTLIKTLFEWAEASHGNIKICVSSRELPIFQQRFSSCPKFRLHEVTRHDIYTFVANTLRNNEDTESLSHPEDMTYLISAIVGKAEGVFLWVSLALSLVERGLVEEDSIEGLKGSINVLPTEIEELFQVIFDSIRREPDTARRRKAMRILSLAVDEVEISSCHGELFLTHLSYMDEYDRHKNFVDDIQGHFTTAEISKRLSRSQKQIDGGCRGFLSILSETWRQNEDSFRRETVRLAHRSLVEFFKSANVRRHMEEHSQGFDKVHFYSQSLIAELKTWSPNTIQFPRRRGYFIGPERLDFSAGDGRDWFDRDVRRLIEIHYHIPNSNLSVLLSALTQLGEIGQNEEGSTSRFNTEYVCQWKGVNKADLRSYCSSNGVPCLPRARIMLRALQWGLFEFWPASNVDNSLLEATLHLVSHELHTYIDSHNSYLAAQPTFDRLLRTLATCFTYGTSANSNIPIAEPHVSISVWQDLVWNSILTMRPKASVVPVWLLFLLHGADENFELCFEQSSEYSQGERLVSVTGYWGPNRQQVHSPIYIHEDHQGIFAVAKGQKWSVSLMDIINFWFPGHAEKFQRIRKMNERGVGLPRKHLQDLRQDFGVEVGSWRTQEWAVPGPLFWHWTGISQLLVKDPVSGQIRKPKKYYFSSYVAQIEPKG